jgi:hypothetical protein
MKYSEIQELRKKDKEKMVNCLSSIWTAYEVGIKSFEECEKETDNNSKYARQAGNCKFLLDMIKQDFSLLGVEL